MSVRADTNSERDAVTATGHSHFQVQSEQRVLLRARLTNRSQDQIRAVLRLQPTLSYAEQDATLEPDRRFLWSGLLQRTLPPIPPQGSVEVELSFFILVAGDYEIGATVDEIKATGMETRTEGKEDDFGGRGLLQRERRTWRAADACCLHVIDSEAK